MLWRFNPLKHELQYFDYESNRILAFAEGFLGVLGKLPIEAGGWKNCDFVSLRRVLPTSTK